MNKKTEKKQEEAKGTKKTAQAKECKSSTSSKKTEKKLAFRIVKFVSFFRQTGICLKNPPIYSQSDFTILI